MGFIFSKIYKVFFSKKLELCILGLENCGKTTFVNQLMGDAKKTHPTIGLNVKEFQQGNINMKVWDIGGQFQYRQNWIDYAKMASVILYMYESIAITKRELHNLLEDKAIENKPFLVLANKIDIEPHMSEVDIIKELNLDYVYQNPWVVISISALKGSNFEKVLDWLNEKADKK